MTKEKIGLVLSWIGVVWMIAWVVAGVTRLPLMHSLTTEEINQTIWAFTGALSMLHGFSIPLGAIVAGVGILLYSGARGSKVWMVGIGLCIVFIISFLAMVFNFYSTPVFAIGGSLILLSFIGILWFLAKERKALHGSSPTAVDFKLAGYIFMVMAAWFICGKAAEGFVKAVEGLPTLSMMNILILLSMGWIFLFLSHMVSAGE